MTNNVYLLNHNDIAKVGGAILDLEQDGLLLEQTMNALKLEIGRANRRNAPRFNVGDKVVYTKVNSLNHAQDFVGEVVKGKETNLDIKPIIDGYDSAKTVSIEARFVRAL